MLNVKKLWKTKNEFTVCSKLEQIQRGYVYIDVAQGSDTSGFQSVVLDPLGAMMGC